ncbi:MAG: T9SS type A sorting domain-containing protein [Crocinitomicaceae bacterium]|nr:T9SS type A sorting domain-containing protein [Crocinitomicaceae bacterium]
MKRTLLSILAVAGFAITSTAQVTITDDNGTDVTNTTINITVGNGNEFHNDFVVSNGSGGVKNWNVVRTRVNEQAAWSDYMCWGNSNDPFGGNCYSSAQMDLTVWTTPSEASIPDGEAGKIKSYIIPADPDFGCVTYRYEIMSGATLDAYVEVVVCKTASIEKIAALNVSVSPNPASSILNIATNGVAGAKVKMVDVLGNIVLSETVIGTSKSINVANFRNGIYFVIVEADGVKTISRKVVVRH